MAGQDHTLASRIKAVLKVCVLMNSWIILSGCDVPPSTQSIPSSPMPDQEQFLVSLVDRNFQDPEAHYQLGEYYHSKGQWDKSQDHLDMALNFAPAFRKCQVALIRMLLDKGDRQAADRAANRFYRQLSNSTMEMADLAKAFAGGGLDSYALACFTEATKVSPPSALAFKELGFYWLGKNDAAKAKASLIHSFELDPSQSDVAGALGELGVVVAVPRTPSESTTQVAPAPPVTPP
jgi:tetratricopeptide (TPR) repeat protein